MVANRQRLKKKILSKCHNITDIDISSYKYTNRHDTHNIHLTQITHNITLNATYFVDPKPYFENYEQADSQYILKAEHYKEIQKLEH